MYSASDAAIQQLCERLQVDSGFLVQCFHASIIEINESDGRWELVNGSLLLLRRLERICHALNVDVSAALTLLRLTQRVAELEEEVRLLRLQA